MEQFEIEEDVPIPPVTRGPKKGVRRFDNQALVRKAAISVINKDYENSTKAAELLISEFKTSSGEKASIITMFQKAIQKEIMRLKACEAS